MPLLKKRKGESNKQRNIRTEMHEFEKHPERFPGGKDQAVAIGINMEKTHKSYKDMFLDLIKAGSSHTENGKAVRAYFEKYHRSHMSKDDLDEAEQVGVAGSIGGKTVQESIKAARRQFAASGHHRFMSKDEKAARERHESSAKAEEAINKQGGKAAPQITGQKTATERSGRLQKPKEHVVSVMEHLHGGTHVPLFHENAAERARESVHHLKLKEEKTDSGQKRYTTEEHGDTDGHKPRKEGTGVWDVAAEQAKKDAERSRSPGRISHGPSVRAPSKPEPPNPAEAKEAAARASRFKTRKRKEGVGGGVPTDAAKNALKQITGERASRDQPTTPSSRIEGARHAISGLFEKKPASPKKPKIESLHVGGGEKTRSRISTTAKQPTIEFKKKRPLGKALKMLNAFYKSLYIGKLRGI